MRSVNTNILPRHSQKKPVQAERDVPNNTMNTESPNGEEI